MLPESSSSAVQPSVEFYGMMRFYEARMYGGRIAVAGFVGVAEVVGVVMLSVS